MLKYSIIILLLFTFSINAEIVKIKDLVTQDNLEAAKINDIKSKKSIFTNHKGEADISDMNNSDSIMISFYGYEKQIISFKEIAENKFIVYLKGTGISFDELVVSANKWQQDKREIPIKMTSIKSEYTLMQNPQTAADLLTLTGEVYVQKSQLGGGSPMIRGFATNRVLITVDGVRMNNAIFRSGNVQNVISLDPLAISNTEVLFGPGSTIYGSDAIGGVMNFYTKAPKFATNGKMYFAANANIRSSSANFEKTGHIDFNLGFKKVAFLTSLTYSDYDDLRMGSNGPDDYIREIYQDRIDGRDTIINNSYPNIQRETGYNQINFMQKVSLKASKNIDIDYGFHYSTTSDYSRYDRLIRYRGDREEERLRSAEWYYGPQEWIMNNFNINFKKPYKIYDQFNLSFAYQYFRESRHDRDFNSIIKSNRIEKVWAYSLNADFVKNLSDKQKLFYGAEAIRNDIGSYGTSENIETKDIQNDASRYPDGSDWSSYSYYLSYRNKLTNKMNIQLGARYNQYMINAEFDTTFYKFPFTKADINAGALTGSAGLVYNPTQSWQFIINVSTGFRSPNIDDIGKIFDSEPGSVVIPNPDLVAEYAYNAEFGLAKIINDDLKIDFSAYYTQLENALVRRDYQLNGQDSIIYAGELSQVQAIQNAANANVWGIQAGIEAKLPLNLTFRARLNYQQGEEELDDGTTAPLRHAPPLFGNIHLIYTINRFEVDFYSDFNGAVSNADLAPSEQEKTYIYAWDDSGLPYSPSWWTLNLKAEYSISNKIMVSGGIENILDVRYRPYSSGISAPGINFIGAVRVSI